LFVVGLLLVVGAVDANAGAQIQGDADCSSEVGAVDALGIFAEGAGIDDTIDCAALADVDCDGDIDLDDGIAILSHLAGMTLRFDLGCAFVGAAIGAPSFVVDETLEHEITELPADDAGPARPVGAVQDPDGTIVQFVANQLVLKPDDDEELQAFLAKYAGVILQDGITEIAAGTPGGPYGTIEHGYYVIRVDPMLSPLDDFIASLEAQGITGRMVFSSEVAARLAAIKWREPHVSLDIVTPYLSVLDHPDDSGGNIDFETKFWMTEDDDPNTAGNQGLSVGVVRAWEYLLYKGLPPTQGIFDPVNVGIVDSGFALHQVTGLPLNGNLDYLYNTRPAQYDVHNGDLTAGGENLMECSGGSSCPWHGTGAFGVCCASPRNGYGGAGTSGKIARPLLIKTDASWSNLAEGIRTAALMNADVVTISSGGFCSTSCADIEDPLNEAIDDAVAVGAIVLAAAGNDGLDISNRNYIPCKLDAVICVGAVDTAGNNIFNFGTGVDIWAPTGILSTVTPKTAALDTDNDVGEDELYNFGGTSAATPFVAGIVAMMKALNPNLDWQTAQTNLQLGANPGGTNVAMGYVDALLSLAWTSPNERPTIDIVRPVDTTVSYTGTNIRAVVTDAEPGKDLPLFDGKMHVEFTDTTTGLLLCDSNQIVYGPNAQIGFECDTGALSDGTHVIEAKVIDAFTGFETDTITLNAVNTAPIVDILDPPSGNQYYATQTIDFSVYVFDPDEDIFFPADRVIWTSNLDGEIGTGTATFHRTLSEGDHTITVTATDSRGVATADSITLHIVSGEGVPVVNIVSPPNNETFGPGTLITLAGDVTDPEEGELPEAGIRWYSDWDGFLGDGEVIQTTLSAPPGNPCQTGGRSHLITLEATDVDGHVVTDTSRVNIGIVVC
jgi:hypothetical protein